MGDLSREAILGATDRPIEAVEVPEWGGTVYVRMLSGRERDQFDADQTGRSDTARLVDFRARFCALVLCDAAGKRLFGMADIAALTEKSAAALDRVFTVAARLNGLTTADQEALAKKLPAAPSASSGSA